MIHLRPIPDDLEFIPDVTGIMYNGSYYYFAASKVKLIREFYAHQGHWIGIWKLAKVAGLKIGCVKVFVGELRPMFHLMKYKIENDQEFGYRIKKMETKT